MAIIPAFSVNYGQVGQMDWASGLQEIPWQQKAADDIVEVFRKGGKGVVLRATTGAGKEHIKCLAMRRLLDEGLIKVPEGSFNPLPFLWLCPKSMKIQAIRTLKQYGLAHLTMVMTYGQIKASDGTSIYIQYVTPQGPTPDDEDVTDPEVKIPLWNHVMRPAMILCNEMQKLKNPSSMISKVVRYAPEDVLWLGDSATPWQRVADARTTVERTRVVTPYNTLPATMFTARAILREIASPRSPDEYSPKACERLRDALTSVVVEVKGIRFKFQTKTTCKTIFFKTNGERVAYEDAYNEYLRECRERGQEKNHGWRRMWVAMQKFQQKAEILRCPQIAERAVEVFTKEHKMVIIASNYVETLRQVWKLLVHVHNVDPDRICFIVGNQTERQRQEQIDKYQRGDADYILFTMKSGGAGISLHHDRATTLPRHIILPPTWSAVDLVQALGRGHRLTSLSPTTQEVLWYGGTVEDRVKVVVERKVKCISKSVTAKEQFMTIFENSAMEDVDPDQNDEMNVELEKLQEHSEGDVDQSDSDSNITGEGLDSVDELEPMPVAYR